MKKIGGIMLILGLGTSLCLGADSHDLSSLITESRQGNTRAMCDLALAYYHGKGVLKDPFKAKCWAKKAHDQGSKRAEKIWNDLSLGSIPANAIFPLMMKRGPDMSPGNSTGNLLRVFPLKRFANLSES